MIYALEVRGHSIWNVHTCPDCYGNCFCFPPIDNEGTKQTRQPPINITRPSTLTILDQTKPGEGGRVTWSGYPLPPSPSQDTCTSPLGRTRTGCGTRTRHTLANPHSPWTDASENITFRRTMYVVGNNIRDSYMKNNV